MPQKDLLLSVRALHTTAHLACPIFARACCRCCTGWTGSPTGTCCGTLLGSFPRCSSACTQYQYGSLLERRTTDLGYLQAVGARNGEQLQRASAAHSRSAPLLRRTRRFKMMQCMTTEMLRSMSDGMRRESTQTASLERLIPCEQPRRRYSPYYLRAGFVACLYRSNDPKAGVLVTENPVGPLAIARRAPMGRPRSDHIKLSGPAYSISPCTGWLSKMSSLRIDCNRWVSARVPGWTAYTICTAGSFPPVGCTHACRFNSGSMQSVYYTVMRAGESLRRPACDGPAPAGRTYLGADVLNTPSEAIYTEI
jgi:hypothetical protein